MPLYEYECKQCYQRVEKIQSFSAPPEKICPKCGGDLERVISAPAFQFKGSGWYVTDYAKSGGKTGGVNGSERKSGHTSESKSESTSESDVATKSSGDSAAANTTSPAATSTTTSAGTAGNSSANSTTSGSSGS